MPRFMLLTVSIPLLVTFCQPSFSHESDHHRATTAIQADVQSLMDDMDKLFELIEAIRQQPATLGSSEEPLTLSNGNVDAVLESMISSSSKLMGGHTVNASIWQTRIRGTPPSTSLTDLIITSHLGFQPLGDRNGVSLASVQLTNPSGAYDSVSNYAGWMNHSLFLLNGWVATSGTILNPQTHASAYAYSLGDASGSNPRSGASWQGAVAGVDTTETSTRGRLLEGDVKVSVSGSTVSVSFTNIVDRETGQRDADLSWSGMTPSGGIFEHNGNLRTASHEERRNLPSDFDSLSGQVYGPNREEVGGIALRNGIAWIFGAKR